MGVQSWNEDDEPTQGLSDGREILGFSSFHSAHGQGVSGKGLIQTTFLEGTSASECLIWTGSEIDIQEHSQD